MKTYYVRGLAKNSTLQKLCKTAGKLGVVLPNVLKLCERQLTLKVKVTNVSHAAEFPLGRTDRDN